MDLRCRRRVNRTIRPRHEEDRALRAPRAAAHAVGSRLRTVTGPPLDVHLLQLAARDERNRVTVGRPEGKRRAFGIGERRDGAVDGSHPQLAPAFGTRREGEALPVGRDDGPVGPVEPEPLGQRDVEARPRLGTFGRCGHSTHGDGGRQRRPAARPRRRTTRSAARRRPRVVVVLGQPFVEDALQAEDDVLRGLPAQLGRLRQARANQVVEPGRRRDTGGGQRGRLGLEDLRDEARLGGRLEGAVPGDHLVEHGAEREDVAPEIGLVPFELLGRHVLQRAGDGAVALRSAASSSLRIARRPALAVASRCRSRAASRRSS